MILGSLEIFRKSLPPLHRCLAPWPRSNWFKYPRDDGQCAAKILDKPTNRFHQRVDVAGFNRFFSPPYSGLPHHLWPFYGDVVSIWHGAFLQSKIFIQMSEEPSSISNNGDNKDDAGNEEKTDTDFKPAISSISVFYCSHAKRKKNHSNAPRKANYRDVAKQSS